MPPQRDLSGVLPGGALDVISEQVKRLAAQGSGKLGFAFGLGLATAIWSANAGVKAMFDALNVAYEESEAQRHDGSTENWRSTSCENPQQAIRATILLTPIGASLLLCRSRLIAAAGQSEYNMLELYHDWRSFCSLKVRLCLAEKGLEWESRYVDLMKLEHTTPEYLKLNPNGVVPTLVHDGVPIVESTLINEYLDEVFTDVPLMPESPVARARVRFWVKYEDDVLHPVIRPATFALMMRPDLAQRSDADLEELVRNHPNRQRAEEYRLAARAPVDHEKVAAARRQMTAALDRLERQLAATEWLGCDTYSLADVAAAPFIDRLEELNLAGLWAGKTAMVDWIARMKARPAYQLAIPDRHQRFAAAYSGPVA